MVDLVAWTVLRVKKDDVLDADPRVSKVAVPSAWLRSCLLAVRK